MTDRDAITAMAEANRLAINPGDRFGRWTVVREAESTPRPGGRKTRQFECLCDCGNFRTVRLPSLTGGTSESCGCLKRERSSAAHTKHGHYADYKRTKAYDVWLNMWGRCTNPKVQRYNRYGGRGIKVCDRWKDFSNFLSDMGEPPPKLTLDRLDNDGDYSPGNCAWRTRSQQQLNRSNARKKANA
jgi:hypothetical protein